MAARSLRQLLVLLVAVCAATAAPAPGAPAAAETELPADGFELELDPILMQQTSAALASQHSKLMADTDVFGLYRDDPASGPVAVQPAAAGAAPSLLPALFPDPFAAFPDQPLPLSGRVSGPTLQLAPVQWITDELGEVKEAVTQEERPVEGEAADTAEGPHEPPRELAYATAPQTLSVVPEALYVEREVLPTASRKRAIEQEVRSASPKSPEPQQSPADSKNPPAEPDAAPLVRRQEATASDETSAPPSRSSPADSHPQPLKFPDTHIFCLLPEPGRHHGPTHAKDERPAESGDKPAPPPPAFGAQPAQRRGAEARRTPQPAAPGTNAGPQPTLFYHPSASQGLSGSQEPTSAGEGTQFNSLWNQFEMDLGDEAEDGQQILFDSFDPFPDPSELDGDDPDSLLDPSQFGQLPGQADGAKKEPQQLLGSPTFFAPYPRKTQYPQRQAFYPPAHRPPTTTNRWMQTPGGWGTDSARPYGARSGRTHRTAYPAPWKGQGRGPTGATGWPWPAIATESRGPPRTVPSSGVYLVSRGGQWPAAAGHPLYSQWYRPAVVPLPGGGTAGSSSGTGWWTPAGRFVRPATAMATSEESGGAGSPPLSADWPWPAVSMLGGRDALVVTGLGRSSGALARAAGEHGWPPVAMAQAGGARDGLGYSRASSGGFGLIFHDGMFHTGPMALSKLPDGYVPPQKLPKKPGDAAESNEDEAATNPETEEEGERETEVDGSGAGEE